MLWSNISVTTLKFYPVANLFISNKFITTPQGQKWLTTGWSFPFEEKIPGVVKKVTSKLSEGIPVALDIESRATKAQENLQEEKK